MAQGKVEKPAAFISVSEKKPAPRPSAAPASPAAKVAAPRPAPIRRPVMDMNAPVRRAIQPVGINAPARRTVKPAAQVAIKPAAKPAIKPAVASVTKPVAKSAAKPVIKPVAKPSVAAKVVRKPVENHVEKSVEKPVENGFEEFDSIFGVIEDYHPAKQPEKIAKRPLSTPEKRQKAQQTIDDALEELEKEDITSATSNTSKPQPEDTPAGRSNRLNDLLKAGKSPFIRTNAIEKRPLSNSVAPKKPVINSIKEEPSDPATIIEKPEKDAHVGIIITVILTIIFGAAIGTAAFLLLPKH